MNFSKSYTENVEKKKLSKLSGVFEKGRGSRSNLPNRFETLSREKLIDPEWVEEGDPSIRTRFFNDSSRSLITFNNSPDVGFEASINPYRGCEHGCAYCYARPTHEYLGFSAGLDFETKIMVKEKAPELLAEELSSKNWRPKVLAMSGVTDPYQPIEKKLRLTRRCLEVLLRFRNPVLIITKNHLIVRDLDLLRSLAGFSASGVFISITSLDRDLCHRLEPRTSRPEKRLEAVSSLNAAGIPVGVMVAPVIPGLNDHEIPGILQASAQAGARFAGMVPVRLPMGVAPLFEEWIDSHYPERKGKILGRIREIRGGKLNDPDFGSRMRGSGPYADQIRNLFNLACRKAGLNRDKLALSVEHFRNDSKVQLALEF